MSDVKYLVEIDFQTNRQAMAAMHGGLKQAGAQASVLQQRMQHAGRMGYEAMDRVGTWAAHAAVQVGKAGAIGAGAFAAMASRSTTRWSWRKRRSRRCSTLRAP